ncbi:hypothetical protein CsSME_00014592 [Camellia sinensis var. sinensis]
MYKDARAEISVLKAENKELKRKATVTFQFGGPPYAAVEEQGVVIVPSVVGNTEATPSRAVQDGARRKDRRNRRRSEVDWWPAAEKKTKLLVVCGGLLLLLLLFFFFFFLCKIVIGVDP